MLNKRYKLNSIVLLCVMLMMLLNSISYASETDTSFERELNVFMETQLSENEIPGVSIVIVKDGKVLLTKGYGYSDVANHKEVDPIEDKFMIASITKVFTTMAVLQLVEQGELDLDTDVNTYLKNYQVENTYPTVLTLRHLLTNTSGFGESIEGIYYDELYDDLISLEKTIQASMPQLVRNPGDVVQYSNYGFSLAGYIVENVTDMPFNEYVEQHIFDPLGMTNTDYFLNPSNVASVSKGYSVANGEYKELTRGTIAVHPAGSIVSTADDMGKFLIANLNNGAFDDKRVLSEELAKAMKSEQFSQNDLLPGYGFGFYQDYLNHDIYIHDGDSDTFTSQISLYPKGNIGYFISYNTMDDGALRDEFEAFVYDHFNVSLERDELKVEAFEKSNENHSDFEGDYVFAQRITDGALKIRGLFLKMSVKFDENNNLVLGAFDTEISGTYEHYKGDLFIKKDNQRKVFLKTGADGQKYIVVDMKVPMQTFEKLDSKDLIFESYVRNYVFAIPFIGFLFWIINLFRKNKTKYEGHAKHVKIITKTIALLIFTTFITIMMVLITQSDSFRSGVVMAANVIGLLILTLCAFLIWKMKIVIKEKSMTRWRGLYTMLVFLGGIGAVLYMSHLDILYL